MLLSILLFPRAFTGQGAFFFYDTWMQNFAFRAWWFGQLKSGHFATWCPGMFAGYPLFAETQTGPLYPPTFLLFSLLPPTLAFSFSVILHFALAGMGVFRLARSLGAGLAAAIFSGLAYQLSGFFVTHVVHFNLLVGAAWAPWMFCFALGAWRGSSRSLMALVIVLGFVLLGAHPYATLMSLLLIALALPFRSRAQVRPLLQGAAMLLLALALALGLAAVQVLPARELLQQTTRGGAVDYTFLTFGSFAPWNVATLVAPNLFGTPVDGSYWAGPDWSHYAETCAYVGVATIVMAVCAVVLRRDGTTLFLASSTSLSLLLMLGKYTPLYRVLSWIPLLQSTRLPARFALVLSLSLALLAGLGLDALVREDSARKRRLAVGSAFLLLSALGVLAWGLGIEARSPDPELAQTGRLWSPVMKIVQENAHAAVGRMLLLSAGTLLALLPFATTRTRIVRAGPWIVSALLAVDLYTFAQHFNPLVPPRFLSEIPPAAEALPKVDPRPRIFRQGVDEFWSRLPSQPRVDLYTPAWKGNESSYVSGAWALPPNSQLLYGVDSGEGFTSLLPLQWLDWVGLSSRPGATPRPDLSEGQADLLALDAVLSSGSGIAGAGWVPKRLRGDLWLSLNVDPLPRVRLARSWETVASREELLGRMQESDYDPRVRVLLERAPPSLPVSSTAGPVDGVLEASELGPGSWDIEIPRGAAGIVIVSESFDSGWRAFGPDRVAVPLFRAEGLFLAFETPASGGRFQLRYEPRSFRLGRLISVASVLVFAALGWRTLRSPFKLPFAGRFAKTIPAWGNAAPFALAIIVVLASWLADVGEWRREWALASLGAAAARSWDQEARGAYAAGALDAAAKLLHAATQRNPFDARLRYRAALVARERGQLGEARASLEEALALDPDMKAAAELLETLSAPFK